MIRTALLYLPAFFLLACATTDPPASHPIGGEEYEHAQLLQSDANRFANLIMRDNLASLSSLLDKLYRRNPAMWKKNGAPDQASAQQQVMEAITSGKPFEPLGELRSIEAIQQALSADFVGDRAGSYIYGIGTMLMDVYGGRQTLTLIHGLDAQTLANSAHNVMTAAWLLASRHHKDGTPLLLSNEILPSGQNLSFEREHGKIIGRLETLAATVDEKLRRGVIGYLQNLSTASFLQFIPITAIP